MAIIHTNDLCDYLKLGLSNAPCYSDIDSTKDAYSMNVSHVGNVVAKGASKINTQIVNIHARTKAVYAPVSDDYTIKKLVMDQESDPSIRLRLQENFKKDDKQIEKKETRRDMDDSDYVASSTFSSSHSSCT